MRCSCLFTCFLALSIFLFSCTNSEKQQLSMQSPDGKIRLILDVSTGKPTYTIDFNKIAILNKSELGIRFQDFEIGKNATISSIKETEIERTWKPLWGEKAEFLDHHKGYIVSLEEEGLQYELEFRLFNDGLGFRYHIPAQDGLPDSLLIMDEKTAFNLSDDFTAWWIEGNYDTYELLYTKSPVSKIGEIKNDFNTHTHSTGGFPQNSAHTPLTMQAGENIFLSIHEAALVDYAGMTLLREDGHKLKANLVPWPDGVKVRTTAPLTTPWRTIQLSVKAGDLVTSPLILNLNEENKLERTDYIEPMKYVGIWWSMHLGIETWGKEGGRHGATTENTKRYIDFAAANNIRGVLVEGWNTGWESWYSDDNFDFQTAYDDFDLKAVTDYAREKGVEIIGHHETGGQVLSYEANLEAALDLYEQHGVKAIKTGYAGTMRPEGHFHQGQFMVMHHQKVVDEAAKRGIMVNIHEPIKDTGLRRTYPNLMTREGVRGMEWNAWSRGNPPNHTPTLVFTRMLSGPLDYTPGIFDLTFENFADQMTLWNELDGLETKGRMHSTLARQLAHYVILFSPMQMAADMIENYEGHPAFEFIRQVPVDWDDTKVLDASIGEFVVMARQKEEDWFVGGITDEQERNITVKLDFLDSGDYEAIVYADAEDTDYQINPGAYLITTYQVSSSGTLDLPMKAAGGFAIHFKRK
ncbi:glycoside hydrolase family 97 protein [Mongoliitalea daihaiensis]|uniref:glycoside hydrolase family 97 protein n=1 Tax=Mongoliitalea daihaiensis TaxID=2782006 RepID=UPI001F36A7C7|nr:glycoside hydrolase family 97 protein [Mongoliitalea daihaiensis]